MIEPAPPCPPLRRLLALIYDLLAVLALLMCSGLICQLVTGGHVIAGSGDGLRIAWWYQPLQMVLIGAYFALSWRYGGQTLGMRAWHIRLRDRAGQAPGSRRIALRLLWAALPMLGLWLAPRWGTRVAVGVSVVGWALWLGWALVDSRKQALHDRLSGCELVKI